MADIRSEIAGVVNPDLSKQVKEAGAQVGQYRDSLKKLKAEKASKEAIGEAVKAYKNAQTQLDALQARADIPRRLDINRSQFEQLMKYRFFLAPAFGLYGGVSGLYDIGPPGCSMKANIIQLWRKHFVIAESMHEVDTTSITPSDVLKVSGHVAKFADMMVRDLSNDKCYRADHLIEEYIAGILDSGKVTSERKVELEAICSEVEIMDAPALTKTIRELGIKAPETEGELSEAYPFNLMFNTMIGPTGKHYGFLRPETAQGIFMNFERLRAESGEVLPFAGACVGQAFRNEISPRQGLLRVLEFTLCEIEHFVDPENKSHANFAEVRDVEVLLFPKEHQETEDEKRMILTTVGKAVDNGTIANETVGYFVGRTALFADLIGLKRGKFRFRQHKDKEMAHYAQDCWDLETLTSYGWVECVGIADRSCYDLTVHSKAANANLRVFVPFDKPISTERLVCEPNKGLMGKALKKDNKAVTAYLLGLEEDAVKKIQQDMEEKGETVVTVEGKDHILSKDMLKLKNKTIKETGSWIVPSVIEPSFGIGRLLYSCWEQSYYIRDDDPAKGVLSLSPIVAPVACSVLPHMRKPELVAKAREIEKILARAAISHTLDASGASIGKRYARTDEIGIPFGITVDLGTTEAGGKLQDTVTLRERDTMKQVRVPISDIAGLLKDLIETRTTWDDVLGKYPAQT